MGQPEPAYNPGGLARLRQRLALGKRALQYPMELAGLSREELAKELGAPLIELPEIPADVPMDDATLTYWDGERFRDMASWPKYTALPPAPPDPLKGAKILRAACGETPITLRHIGGRWLMWAGTGRGKRRKDFASPFADHARRTAEFWYGAPVDGWQGEKGPAPKRKPPGREKELP